MLIPETLIKCLELLFLSLTIIVMKFAGIKANAIPIKNITKLLFICPLCSSNCAVKGKG